ncbi:hypothetical protein K438DRAFT_1981312 [Mycena galopus ATCC 62051]|nr:hypothetical protein K438DRAFT_1981312 [Mycena galopus ATCC 62051]
MTSSGLNAFDLVSKNLLAIGALSINDFLSSKYEPPQVVRPPPSFADVTPALPSASGSKAPVNAPPNPIPSNRASLSQLHSTCVREFGQSYEERNAKFDFLQEAGGKKQCILTITRLDGSTRSYKTEFMPFPRKVDAKAAVADIAVEHGAIDFIIKGDSDELKAKKGVLLAPLDDNQPVASTSKLSPSSLPQSSRAEEIETCCREWRGDQVKPYWLEFNDPGIPSNCGAALKIQLAPHCWRVYSCEPSFDSSSEAREHCADLAISEGVLEFIKYGNGQTAPRASSPAIKVGSTELLKQDLQSFYESLPQPSEEPFPDKTAAEINAPMLLGNILATAKGTRFTAQFYPLAAVDDRPTANRKGAATSLQGRLLRLKRPGECRTYLVEPQFSSQKEAKAAVSLLALSLGAGKWIRETRAAAEARITPAMRRFAVESMFQALATEARRASGIAPRFEWHTDGDAFGALLEVNFTPPVDGVHTTRTDARCYEVPAEYCSKPDARIAVALLAVQQGIIDLLRNGGQPLPPDQPPAFSIQNGQYALAPNPSDPPTAEKKANKKKKKRKDGGGGESEGPPAKKQKAAPGANTASGANTVKLLPKKPKPSGGMPGLASASLPPKPKPAQPSVDDGLYNLNQRGDEPSHKPKKPDGKFKVFYSYHDPDATAMARTWNTKFNKNLYNSYSQDADAHPVAGPSSRQPAPVPTRSVFNVGGSQARRSPTVEEGEVLEY